VSSSRPSGALRRLRARLTLGGLTLGFFALGCAGAVESSKLEDRARRTVPVPICLKAFERHGTSGVISALNPEDYWSLVLPGFDRTQLTVDASSADCAGRPAFAQADLLEAEGARTGLIPVKPDDAMIASGPDGFRIVWLRTHRFPGGASSGPLSLVRPREGYAEVYATGQYRGAVATSRFSLERMGPRILVTATDEGCAGVKPNQACETSFSIYLLSAGRLARAATFPLDRVEYRSASGEVAQFRLTATPVFQENAIRVVEQVIVSAPSQGTIRKADLERVYSLQPNGTLRATADSLWSQVAAETAGSNRPPVAPTPAAPPAKR
jgi:hypothetical protein